VSFSLWRGSWTDGSNADATPVSSDIWIYIVTTVPITALIVVFWLWYDRRRERRYKEEDEKLETDIEKMEKEIMQHLRQRALNKTRTWKSSIATAAVKA
jgi:type VI protein secretion system component VasK